MIFTAFSLKTHNYANTSLVIQEEKHETLHNIASYNKTTYSTLKVRE